MVAILVEIIHFIEFHTAFDRKRLFFKAKYNIIMCTSFVHKNPDNEPM